MLQSGCFPTYPWCAAGGVTGPQLAPGGATEAAADRDLNRLYTLLRVLQGLEVLPPTAAVHRAMYAYLIPVDTHSCVARSAAPMSSQVMGRFERQQAAAMVMRW